MLGVRSAPGKLGSARREPGICMPGAASDCVELRRAIVVVVKPEGEWVAAIASRYFWYWGDNRAIASTWVSSPPTPGNWTVAETPWTSLPSAVLKDGTRET